ncbi:hypothetical protein SAICODRAFT_87703 [Saitoella complicata NRRL Y-17804]|uniref:Uncharacterized protein n=1 Tax=Saitoella complicata (strain BCRC 22490 / CBS 7301 / JCM 7358 / NBRC 10748 / NRRL Y-17804) TaxID=698492 RepID=A0A0E9N894_SAICN|nr:uncharacterized protein SAICODRAFT_87703 [Saitoella complicata NRRL Y-17804]ODQ55632.1 hypothetical protein SAICODRAFT_87703 [Saitoella complicata NRRL Y-17804]GAO46049.1 hypothetical protein G7K_0292-t1 [Saitoella complicata NRRL Y-17804]
MGGGARFPYPKHVWSPSGGWWSQPKNWKMNTALTMGAILLINVWVFKKSAELEKRYNNPSRWIPSMLWSKEFLDGKWKVGDETEDQKDNFK